MRALNALSQALLLCAAFVSGPAFTAANTAAAVDASAVVRVAAGDKAALAKAKAASKAAKKPSKKPSSKTAKKKTSPKKDAKPQKPGPLADFGKVEAPADVVHVANWVSYSRNHGKHAFMLIDKKMARLYVFSPQGKLRSHSPILLGQAVGDETAPGVGEKSLAQIADAEKTTAAGRFPAYLGKNNHGEDIIWIDYDSGLSMHRVRKVKEEERRFERMATPQADDNRISNGCVNVPHTFYNKVVYPTVKKEGAFIYVLPETKAPQQLFRSFDVPPKKG